MKTVGEILAERDAHVQSCALFYVSQGQSVSAVCRRMVDNDVGAVCVFEGTRLVGVFSERDLLRRVVAKELDPAKVNVEDVMTRKVLVTQPQEDYKRCLQKMQRAKVRHLPVVGEDKVVGMLSIRDLFQE